MPPDHDLILLSHHKCATNWLRAICDGLARLGIAECEVAGGRQTSSPHAGVARKILLNVNANRMAEAQFCDDPCRNIHFVRDPRDAFVSTYFSWRYSHDPTNPVLIAFRARADTMSVEDGMLDLVEHFAMGRQLSGWTDTELTGWTDAMWARSTPVRYEDLLADFPATLQAIVGPAGIVLTAEQIDALRQETSFSRMSGRSNGGEDVKSHFRKGAAGDWVNHFTPALQAAFEARYGWLGPRLGYW